MTTDAQTYIDDMVAKRGYVLDYHRVMAAADFPVLQAANQLVGAAYLRQRTLDRKTKELLFILSLTVMRAPSPQLRSHIQVGLDLGLTPQEILEAIEISCQRRASWHSNTESRRGRTSFRQCRWSRRPPGTTVWSDVRNTTRR